VDPRPLLTANSRIAAGLVDALITSGDRAAASRVLELVGDRADLSPGDWLPEEILAAMFRTAAGDARLPERVGRELVCSPRAGLFLRYSGVATPEKAYRRCDQILAREARGALYEVAEVVSGHARILFHPAEGTTPESNYCALRSGMLEAVPTVYGLLPARVREMECVTRGDAACVYDVRWRRSSRRGACVAALAGLVSGVVLAELAGLPPWGLVISGLVAGAIGATAGRSFDLARQLDAVAGARRGQLALLDQVDRSLAEKMDQFARLEAFDGAASRGVGSRAGEAGGPGLAGLTGSAEALGLAGGGAQTASRAGVDFQPVDLVSVVRRAVESQQLQSTFGPAVQFELPEQAMVVDGEPHQLEMVVLQLIQNAAAAASAEGERGGDASGSVRVSLRVVGDSLELAVEDDGFGIEEEMVDQIFDPFLARASASGPRGLGLAVAYRVVEEHGGELRLESAPGQGTRITARLPRRQGDDA